jgi:hypothetical protein
MSIGSSEFPSLGSEGLVVLEHKLSDLGFQWVLSVGVLHQSDERFDDKLSVESWNPVVFNGLSADLTSVLLDVGVEDLGLEQHLYEKKYIRANWHSFSKLEIGSYEGDLLTFFDVKFG